MIELRVRKRVEVVVAPLGKALSKIGLTPTGVTVLGLLVTIAGAVVLAVGEIVIGAWIIAVGSALDSLDGAVARVSGRVTDRGALVDSVADRVGETAMWASLAYAISPDNAIGVLLCGVSLGGSIITSYLRAKAESLGVEGRGGIMGRAERVILFTAGITFGWITPMLWLMAVLTWATVAQRFVFTWRQIDS